MNPVRPATLAGSWYPGTAAECQRKILEFTRHEKEPESTQKQPVGGIVPHAGWFFSGQIACRVIAAVCRDKVPDLVAIFGMHMHSQSRPLLMGAGSCATPLGPLDIDAQVTEALSEQLGLPAKAPDRFPADNTIELQLPFIKHFAPDAQIVVLGVPPAPVALTIGQAVAKVARQFGRRLRVLGSTDLTHYGPNYGFAPKGRGPKAHHWVVQENDRAVIDAMLAMDADQVLAIARKQQNACCAGAVAAAVAAGYQMGAGPARQTEYASSYDRHPDDSFVGYVGIIF